MWFYLRIVTSTDLGRCVLFGKTYAREHGEGESSGCGAMCCAWYCAASFGFNSCLQCIMRGQQREKYGIEGSGFGDCCASFWCGCCTLIQEEKESVVRITGRKSEILLSLFQLTRVRHGSKDKGRISAYQWRYEVSSLDRRDHSLQHFASCSSFTSVVLSIFVEHVWPHHAIDPKQTFLHCWILDLFEMMIVGIFNS